MDTHMDTHTCTRPLSPTFVHMCLSPTMFPSCTFMVNCTDTGVWFFGAQVSEKRKRLVDGREDDDVSSSVSTVFSTTNMKLENFIRDRESVQLLSRRFAPKDIQVIEDYLLSSTKLRMLDLSRSALADWAVKALSAAMVESRSLNVLILQGCSLSDGGIIALAEVICSPTTIQYLDMSCAYKTTSHFPPSTMI
jgi:hypothetical protein